MPERYATSTHRSSRLTPFVVDQTLLMFDVILELMAEMFGEAADGEDSGIGQRANGAACHVVAHRSQQVEVVGTAPGMFATQ